MKEILGLDLDEPIAPTYDSFANFYNRKYNTLLAKSNFFTLKLEDVFGISTAEAKQLLTHFESSAEFINMKPVLGSKEALEKLCVKYRLIIVTARNDSLRDITVSWIDKHMHNLFGDILFASDYKRKYQICKELGIKTIIDDSPYFVKECLDNGVGVLLYDAPWNQLEITGAIRVKSWDDILKHLLMT